VVKLASRSSSTALVVSLEKTTTERTLIPAMVHLTNGR